MAVIPVLKINYEVRNRIKLYTTYIKVFSVLKNNYVNDNEAILLAYYMMNGINKETQSSIMKEEEWKNISLIYNSRKTLVDKGFLYKEKGEYKLCNELESMIELNSALVIKLNIISDEFKQNVS